MTKTYLPLLLLLCIMFTACQKETSIDTTNGGGNNGARIARLVYQYSASDSSVTELRYDASGRFIGYTAPNGEPLMGDHLAFTINRNSTGIIQSYTYRDATTTGTEETTYNVFYDASRRQYTHKLATLQDSAGNVYLDSTVFVYNGQKVETSRYYIKEPVSGLSGELSQSKFAYDGPGNVATINLLFTDFSTTNLVPLVELGFQYDGKVNPLALGVEGVLTDFLFFISPANFTKVTARDLATPGSTPVDFISATYTYRSDNRPEKATLTVDSNQIEVLYRYN
ncbi:hypothetical protein SAMN05444008_12247 [Cnuella takakiae]|uniref:YD repeat-containing protein n=1 Tax=Cnuella takakiae TaxID=1302690 RepID=A0A1M5I862_9BACT|nr:hypothetical protein [Cnuella takakiae]OLY93215.1 hypothetical protein BUE76_15955 [Cnuella takakiae]SHG24475.1 hypothetical protein SAMN05444008_12247 [Cnuella takakiae]